MSDRLSRQIEGIRQDAAAVTAAVRLSQLGLPETVEERAQVDPGELAERLDLLAVVVAAAAERVELAALALAVELREGGQGPPAAG